MKLLELIPSLRSGGAEKFVVELSNEIAKSHNTEVHIVQLSPMTEQDICAKSIDESVTRYSLNKRKGFSIKCLLDIYNYIRKNQITHVHAHTSAISYILLSIILCWKVRFFATIHSDARLDADESWFIALIRKVLFYSKRCTPITISKESHKSFIDFYKIDAPLIINGVSSRAYTQNDNDITNPFDNSGISFIHIARVNKQKNQIVLYSAIQKLIDEGYDVTLYHYGRFESDDLSQKLRSMRNSRIHIMGEIDDARRVLPFADAMCLSSQMEGMPITIIESLSVGCPVICTPVGGCINMIENMKNGILSKACDSESYYLALKDFILMSNDRRKQMKIEALKSFTPYDIKNTATAYLELFSSVK